MARPVLKRRTLDSRNPLKGQISLLEYLHLVFLRWMDLLVAWALELTSEKQRRRGSQPEVELWQNAEIEDDDTVKHYVSY